jgi:hypothetical protein
MWLSVSTATAGRLIETGEVPDVSCVTNPALGACDFIRTAVDYVRMGSPDPSKPVLVLDEPPNKMVTAIRAAYGGSPPFMIVAKTPSTIDFSTLSLTPTDFSAMVVASDFSCGGLNSMFNPNPCGDLNPNTYGTINNNPQHPWYANDPCGHVNPCSEPQVPPDINPFTGDSDALVAPPGHNAINNFYNMGGGIFVASGGDNGDGHGGDLYYDFVNTPRGSVFNGDPSSLTDLGRGIGFTASDIGHVGCPMATVFPPDSAVYYLECPFDAFFPLPTGSSLRVAEVDNLGDPVTLFEDTDPPVTTITTAPPSLVVSRGPTSASFTFTASENLVTFQCRLDSGPFTPCSSPETYNNLSEGEHVFSARAIDAAGNVEGSPPATSWLLAFDRDGDGFTRFSNPPDCNDNDPTIYPGAPEQRGGHVDSDCDGIIDPFLRIHEVRTLLIDFRGGSTVVTKYSVSSIPAGATVSLSCAGHHRCPFRPESINVGQNTRVNLLRRLKGVRLRPGVVLVVRITAPQTIGAYWSETMGRPPHAPKQRTACMNPGTLTPQSTCPDYSP